MSDKNSSVNTLGGKTKITLAEGITILTVVISLVLWLNTRFNRIDGILDQTWSVQNQAEWQRDYERNGVMPDPFSVRRRSSQNGNFGVSQNNNAGGIPHNIN